MTNDVYVHDLYLSVTMVVAAAVIVIKTVLPLLWFHTGNVTLSYNALDSTAVFASFEEKTCIETQSIDSWMQRCTAKVVVFEKKDSSSVLAPALPA